MLAVEFKIQQHAIIDQADGGEELAAEQENLANFDDERIWFTIVLKKLAVLSKSSNVAKVAS